MDTNSTLLRRFEYEFVCLFLQLRENRNPCFQATLLALAVQAL